MPRPVPSDSPWTPAERRLLGLAANPGDPPRNPPDTPAGRDLVATHRAWGPRRQLGLRVDVAALHVEERKVAVAIAAGVERFGVDVSGDTDATRDWLWRRLGVMLARDPETGRPSVSSRLWAEAVVPPGSENDWAAWCELRAATRLSGVLTSIRNHLDDNGRVYPRINVAGTITGRMSVTDPGLQTLSGSQRHLLVPDTGMVLVGGDVHAMEPTLAAWLARDENLIADLAADDPYQRLAERIGGGTPEDRSRAKTALLAQLYGQGTKSLGRRLKVLPGVADELVGELRARYPKLFTWLRELEADNSPATPWGRRLPRPPDDPETGRRRGYLARNWRVQGSSADLFRQMTLRVAEVDPSVLWFPYHDELVLQTAPERAERAAAYLTEVLSPCLDGVQFRAEVKIYRGAWGK